MKILIATDSYKGSLSSIEAGQAIANGIERVADAETIICPIADGGEGTVETLVEGMNGKMMSSTVTGPLGLAVLAKWGIIEVVGDRMAVIEMAAAAGITLVPDEERNPLNTTTYGVGQLIKEAIQMGCRKFIIGIGGSSTNDGGAGMLQALGFDLLDDNGQQIEFGAKGLRKLVRIERDNVIPELKECIFRIACDVKNPLCGDEGCSAVYGPQKGATPDMIRQMDNWLRAYATISGGDMEYPGTGAAGGLGFAFLSFTNATLESGIDIIISETNIEKYIKEADIVITGEGRMDSQTVMGKVPVGISRLAKKYNKTVIAFCGCASDDADICNNYGIDAYFTILRNIVSVDEALDKVNAANNLSKTVEQVFRLIGEKMQ